MTGALRLYRAGRFDECALHADKEVSAELQDRRVFMRCDLGYSGTGGHAPATVR